MKTIKLFTLFIITVIILLVGAIINNKFIIYGGVASSVVTFIRTVNEENENGSNR